MQHFYNIKITVIKHKKFNCFKLWLYSVFLSLSLSYKLSTAHALFSAYHSSSVIKIKYLSPASFFWLLLTVKHLFSMFKENSAISDQTAQQTLCYTGGIFKFREFLNTHFTKIIKRAMVVLYRPHELTDFAYFKIFLTSKTTLIDCINLMFTSNNNNRLYL